MDSPERKIIFLDIDGTLTEPGQNVPPASALEAIAGAQTRGHLVYLCSGRNRGMLSPLLRYGFDGYIASSGGYICCGDEVIYNHPLSRELQEKAMSVLLRCGVFRTIESVDNTFTDEAFKEFLRSQTGEGNSEFLRWREQIEKELNILPMAEYDGSPIYKIVVASPGADRLEEAQNLLGEELQFCIQDPAPNGLVNGELISRDYDKGKGLERVCAHLGIKVENSFGFGDSMNDVELIQTAGTGICMDNGSASLKALSDDVCPAVGDDGLKRAFEKYGLL